MSTPGPNAGDKEDLVPPGTKALPLISLPAEAEVNTSKQNETVSTKVKTSRKGIENAKKRLRAFSIQKKNPVLPTTLPKLNTTATGKQVVIGKLSSVKPHIIKQDHDSEQKKMPKPPKPGAKKPLSVESYTEVQKKTLTEIENMKRKIELVELGIPLGLICPEPNSDKAMPTKAMPPIKSFLASNFDVLTHGRVHGARHTKNKRLHAAISLQPSKVDDLIREAKKARAEGKEFKFDYQKLLPDYDNPFQRKKDEGKTDEKVENKKYDKFDHARGRIKWLHNKNNDNKSRRDKEKSCDSKTHSDYKKDQRDHRDRNTTRGKDKPKDKVKDEIKKEKQDPVRKKEKYIREAEVNLNDYLVCDSWSLDTEDKNEMSSPKTDEQMRNIEETTTQKSDAKLKLPTDQLRECDKKYPEPTKSKKSKESETIEKFEKLQPVIDSFKYEIDPEEDDEPVLDIFDANSDIANYSTSQKIQRSKSLYESPKNSRELYDSLEMSNESSQNSSTLDEFSSKFANDTFLESVINEIKQEDMSDDMSQDKGFLVEYDLSPERPEDIACSTPEKADCKPGSVTPELDDSYYDLCSSQRSDYSESGFRSTESGCKSSESGYKSNDSFRLTESLVKDYDDYATANNMSKATVDSLDTWSFVLKICQPLLFRHDNNDCYRNTRVNPKLWYAENPKICNCVKDRSIVYEELETCKMSLVDRVYGCDQILDSPYSICRTWYPRVNQCLTENTTVHLTSTWETDDSSQNSELPSKEQFKNKILDATSDSHCDEMDLDMEYKRFMDAVWPEVSETKSRKSTEKSRSNTPVKSEMGTIKMPKEESHEEERISKNMEDKKEESKRNRNNSKVNSDDWSQESDVQEGKRKRKREKSREKKKKRKYSTSSDSDSSDLEEDIEKHKKKSKKKDSKQSKSKSDKIKRAEKKRLQKLKEKQRKKLKKLKERGDKGIEMDVEEELRKEKSKSKDKKKLKKKELKLKKKEQKKKRARAKSSSSSETSTTSSSSSSSESSSTESESEKENKKKRKKRKEAKRKRKENKRDSLESHSQKNEFDLNILKNIKTERLTDDEKTNSKVDIQDFSPRRQSTMVQRQEIINVKELQSDIGMHIKQEVIEEESDPVPPISPDDDTQASEYPETAEPIESIVENDSPQENLQTIQDAPDMQESDLQQEPSYNIPNYNLEDIIMPTDSPKYDTETPSDMAYPQDSVKYQDSEVHEDAKSSIDDTQTQYDNEYEQYADYEQRSYQSDNNFVIQNEPENEPECRQIETLVSASGSRGEIKCDWRPGERHARSMPVRPSRWGLKPSDANIVLTGAHDPSEEPVYQIRSVLDPGPVQTYRIETISTARSSEVSASPVLGYDEAYADMYGAADKLQYGDCFAASSPGQAAASSGAPAQPARRSLDARIDRALKETVLGLVTEEAGAKQCEEQSDAQDKGGILVNAGGARAPKRVSFADGYAPGQDSDTEPPPKKRKKSTKQRPRGCAWPCPVSHPDHVPLWDALPPPDPPPGSPPPAARAPAPATALAVARPALLPTPFPLRRGYEATTALTLNLV